MRRVLPYALFLTLVCVFLWRPIFAGRALLPGDYLAQMSPWKNVITPASDAPQWNPLQWDAIAQFYPWRVFYARSMLQGHIPLWTPHQFCGTPFLANGQSAVLYPLNLLFLIFNPITALTIYAALHLFLAAVFTYWLLRELGCNELGGIVGGITFAFSAFMVLWLELLTFPGAAIWLPLALLLIHRAVERRSLFYGMLSGLALAMSVLAGHFQIAFYVIFAAVLWWVWKLIEVIRHEGQIYAVLKVVVPFVGCLATLALIAAPQVLPTVELAMNSHRSGGPTDAGYDWFIANSLKPYRLITAFAPDFYGNPSKSNYFLLGGMQGHAGSAADYMEYGMYCGILPLMLALIALFGIRKERRSGFFVVLAGLSLLCALGTPINWVFYWLIPGFSSFGGPNRMLILYCFGIAVMAGFGTSYLCGDLGDKFTLRGKTRSWSFVVALLATHTVIFSGVALRYMAQSLLVGRPEFAGSVALSATVAYIAVLVISDLLILTRSGKKMGLILFEVLAIILIVSDLFAFGINYNPTCERSKVYPKTELTTKLQKLAKNSRIAPINPNWSLYETPKAILPPNSAMVYGLYDVQGYDSLYLREYKDLLYKIEGVDPSPLENGNMALVRRPTERLKKLAQFVISPKSLSADYLVSKASVEGVELYGIKNARSMHNYRNTDFFTFHLGLYLMCVGITALWCVGVYRVMKHRHPIR